MKQPTLEQTAKRCAEAIWPRDTHFGSLMDSERQRAYKLILAALIAQQEASK